MIHTAHTYIEYIDADGNGMSEAFNCAMRTSISNKAHADVDPRQEEILLCFITIIPLKNKSHFDQASQGV